MKFKNIKNLANNFFPDLIKQSKVYGLYSKIDLLFHDLVMAETEQEFLKIAQEVHKVNNEETVKEYYPNALRELNNLVALGEAIILNPKDYAIILNEELNKISEEIAKITDLEEQNELRKLLVFNSFNCACVSIFATLNNLSEKEKEEQYNIQQSRLNIVLQNDIKKENEANYWYSLHWFIRGNKNNATFYLKKMINQKAKLAILTEEDNMLWIKNKLPKDFLEFVQVEYQNIAQRTK